MASQIAAQRHADNKMIGKETVAELRQHQTKQPDLKDDNEEADVDFQFLFLLVLINVFVLQRNALDFTCPGLCMCDLEQRICEYMFVRLARVALGCEKRYVHDLYSRQSYLDGQCIVVQSHQHCTRNVWNECKPIRHSCHGIQ